MCTGERKFIFNISDETTEKDIYDAALKKIDKQDEIEKKYSGKVSSVEIKNDLKNTDTELYNHFMNEIKMKLKYAKNKSLPSIDINIPYLLFVQDEFNTVGNENMSEYHTKGNKKYNPSIPSENKIEEEHGLFKRGPYEGESN